MSHTEGRYVQDLPATDLQIFRGPSDFVDVAGHATYATGGAGLYSLALASTLAGTFFTDLLGFHRTGMYANAALDQQQFGTAASVPGPSTVANTNSPLGSVPGYPPLTQSQMTTLGHVQFGPIPKGMFISSVDVVYDVNTVAAALATVGITNTAFVEGSAPAVTNVLALGVNGMLTTVGHHVVNIPLPANTFTTGSDVVGVMNVNLTAGSGGTINFYGVEFHETFNLN
jgi:hypothetical protein